MNKQFSPETVAQVLGNVEINSEGEPKGVKPYQRTPLHVKYGQGPGFAKARKTSKIDDAAAFNAVGSRINNGPGVELHLPVLDLDGGARVQRAGRKAVIFAGRYDPFTNDYIDRYRPPSLLRDVLGDNGIDLEVFQAPYSDSVYMSGKTIGTVVTGIALRTANEDTFAAVDSTQKGHSHLYIQQAFSAEDHRTLVDELAYIGVVSERWGQLTEQEGMGVVRTPWTEREVTHVSS